MNSRLVILINPRSLHKTLCQKLANAGFDIIAVYTYTPSSIKYFVLDKKYFIASEQLNHILKSDINRLKKLIGNYKLIDVMPSDEKDLKYAEEIAYSLNPKFSNKPDTSNLRFNKYDMNEALKNAGLNSISQICIPYKDRVPDKINLNFPVIVKPSFQSGGGYGVKSCNTILEIKNHVKALREGNDILGAKFIADIVIQEKIDGIEYSVDSVSWNNQHYITMILAYKKRDVAGFPIINYGEFIPPEDTKWKLCYEYMLKVLKVLKFEHGFAHTEFMISTNNQCYLMELNPRLSGLGGEINRFCKLLNGYDQSDIYIDLIKNNQIKKYEEWFKTNKLKGRIIFLFSWKTLIFYKFNHDVIKKLQSSQVFFRQFKEKDSLLTPPSSLADIVLSIIIIDENMDKINADTHYLQELEQNNQLFN
jgi:predicted ATP-grasp superfamily ATP-dependent carboligase